MENKDSGTWKTIIDIKPICIAYYYWVLQNERNLSVLENKTFTKEELFDIFIKEYKP